MKSKVELEEMGEIVCEQLTIKKNGTDASSTYSLGKKFLPQTPVEKKYYGTLAHQVDTADYVDSLIGEEKLQEVPAKAGFYQFSKHDGFFSQEHKVKLYEEYKKAQDDTYKEYTDLRAKY